MLILSFSSYRYAFHPPQSPLFRYCDSIAYNLLQAPSLCLLLTALVLVVLPPLGRTEVINFQTAFPAVIVTNKCGRLLRPRERPAEAPR